MTPSGTIDGQSPTFGQATAIHTSAPADGLSKRIGDPIVDLRTYETVAFDSTFRAIERRPAIGFILVSFVPPADS